MPVRKRFIFIAVVMLIATPLVMHATLVEPEVCEEVHTTTYAVLGHINTVVGILSLVIFLVYGISWIIRKFKKKPDIEATQSKQTPKDNRSSGWVPVIAFLVVLISLLLWYPLQQKASVFCVNEGESVWGDPDILYKKN